MHRRKKKFSPAIILLFVLCLAAAVAIALLLPESLAELKFSIGAIIFVLLSFISVALYRQVMKKRSRPR